MNYVTLQDFNVHGTHGTGNALLRAIEKKHNTWTASADLNRKLFGYLRTRLYTDGGISMVVWHAALHREAKALRHWRPTQPPPVMCPKGPVGLQSRQAAQPGAQIAPPGCQGKVTAPRCPRPLGRKKSPQQADAGCRQQQLHTNSHSRGILSVFCSKKPGQRRTVVEGKDA